MSYFTAQQTKLLNRIESHREIIAEQKLEGHPCKHFDNQLNTLAVLTEVLANDIRLLQKELSAKESGTSTDAPYGYCPVCGAKGVSRERRPGGYDICANGHTYPSKDAQS